MTGRPLDIRPLRADDDLEAELDLRNRAFGPVADRDEWMAELQASIRAGTIFAVLDGSRLVGTGMFHDMRQWWHGRSLPMAGVALVKIAPEDRGRGAGKTLMTELLHEIAVRRYPVCALYPVTAPIYRSLGWEIAGALQETVIPARSLGSLIPPDAALVPPDAAFAPDAPHPPPAASARRTAAPQPMRRAGPKDAEQVLALNGRMHQAALDCGPNTRDVEAIRQWLGDPSVFAYLAPDGFLAYGWHGRDREILVQLALSGSAETTRAIWGILASHASMSKTIRAWLAPEDPVGFLTRELDARAGSRKPWMLRLVDAPAAISARGYPAAAQASVALQVHDTALPANSGLWTLQVSGGQGCLTPFETARGRQLSSAGPLRLGARGLAALYGGVPAGTLRRAGLASGGDPAADAVLDGAFAGPAFMLDYF